jgi:hypothetical protein
MPLLMLLSVSPVLHAAQPAPGVDAELLEFLGSVDDEEGWQEFLEQMPLQRARADTAARKPESLPPAKPPATPESRAPAGAGKAAQTEPTKVKAP